MNFHDVVDVSCVGGCVVVDAKEVKLVEAEHHSCHTICDERALEGCHSENKLGGCCVDNCYSCCCVAYQSGHGA